MQHHMGTPLMPWALGPLCLEQREGSHTLNQKIQQGTARCVWPILANNHPRPPEESVIPYGTRLSQEHARSPRGFPAGIYRPDII